MIDAAGESRRDDGPNGRWSRAVIDAGAIAHNVETLRDLCAPAAVWAVVKADGYGHGAVDIARAALDAGAAGLCVALVQEGVDLRAAGIEAPVLVLSEQPAEQIDELLDARLTPTVYTVSFVRALAASAAQRGRRVAVHVNVDTGMQRVGVRAPADLIDALRAASDALSVEGVYTHLACADEPSHPANVEQLCAFEAALEQFSSSGLEPSLRHVANSAGAIAHPNARHSLVRAGIAIYGVSPGAGVDHLCTDLRPAMRLVARVSHVKPVEAGSHVSYGWRHRFTTATTVATVPLGYADGVPRRLGTLEDRAGAEVLIGGRRRPIVGVVTMDQFMVDVGSMDVAVGDEVVLLGSQGDERISVEEWADRLGTIGYEIVCAIGPRVPRVVVGRRADLGPS